MQTIYMWLCNYIDKKGECYPGRRTLAKLAGCSIRTLDKYMKQLEDDGFIVKKNQYQEGKGQTSNLYQVQLLSTPVSNDDTTPMSNESTGGSAENDTLTQSITNSTTLTLLSTNVDTQPEEEIKVTTGQLPDKFGKSYIDRVLFVYRTLWSAKFGTPYELHSFGKFGLVVKRLNKIYTEYQIAALLLTYFNWYGATGIDDREYLYLSSKGFPIELMPSKVSIMIAYLTNRLGVEYTSEDSVKSYVVKNLKPLL